MADTIAAPGLFTSTWDSGNEHFDRLVISSPARAVVSYDPLQNVTALIVVTASSEELKNLVNPEIVDKRVSDIAIVLDDNDISTATKELNVRMDNRDVDAEGTLLIEITLNHPIQDVITTTETIIKEGVLPLGDQDKQVSVTSLSGKNVWVETANPIHVAKLVLIVGGSGHLYVTAPSTLVDGKLSANLLGSGTIGMKSPTVVADLLESTIPGSGSIFIEGDIDAKHLKSSVLGSGSVNLYPSGRCFDDSITILGSGNAYVGSIACNTTNVETLGSGNAVVQTSDTLTRSGFGSGSIKYFNVTPLHLPPTKKKHSFFSFKQLKVESTENNKYKTFEVQPQPSLTEGAHVHVVIHTGWFFWPPSNSQVTTSPHDAISMNACNGIGAAPEFALVGFGLFFIALIAFVVQKKIKRGGYQLLK